jgi:two-component system sensor histidine kinase AlgZ
VGNIDPSINQPFRLPDRLPDFLNTGVWLRAVLAVTGLCMAASLLADPDWNNWPEEFAITAARVLPPTLLTLMVSALMTGPLSRLRYSRGIAAILVIATLASAASAWLLLQGFNLQATSPARRVALTLLVTGVVLFYFHLRDKALSPALTEARLQALQARIRPHFLFNSINAVLSLVRSEPRRAEEALEDLADLFRVLMADNRDLSPLGDEVALSRQYLDLEQLRLGNRLKVIWHIDKMPRDALVPPLVLQPLLENAVYHGIETSAEPGEITVNIFQSRGEVHMVLRNPFRPGVEHTGGNQMALANIRERLSLHFDEEGRLETRIRDGSYQVHIRLPYRKATPA